MPGMGGGSLGGSLESGGQSTLALTDGSADLGRDVDAAEPQSP
jgi:hypothetical protein